MRRSPLSVVGATLIEIMLVLAIIVLIILMSVRYYQSTATANQTDQVMGMISAITAAADNLSLGSADGYSNVTAQNMAPVLGSANMNSPWGGSVVFSAGNTTSYTVTIPKPTASVCTAVLIKLKANSKFTNTSCTDGGNLNYTYNSTC